jgi:catechol 2,3-dioxygenase-like lactoylglutathione lyase family enzyme
VPHHLRIARPVSDLARSAGMYCRGLGFTVIDRFEDHAGFDGVMLGIPGAAYHLELTHCRERHVTPTAEDLLVFYVPEAAEWEAACTRLQGAGFKPVAPFNPYWGVLGRTFEDPDGYRIVLQRERWK